MEPCSSIPAPGAAIEDSGDRHHAAAIRFKEELAQRGARLYVTNFVFDESYTSLWKETRRCPPTSFWRVSGRALAWVFPYWVSVGKGYVGLQ